MTLKEACERGAAQLRESGIDDASLDAWYLLEHVTGLSRASYLLNSQKELEAALEERFLSLIKKRAGRIPLQHLTGVQEFMGLEFLVSEHVLIPRQDTESLVEEALYILGGKPGARGHGRDGLPALSGDTISLLDLCTGSGCILLSILKHAEKNGRFRVVKRPAFAPSKKPSCQPRDFGAVPLCGTGSDISREALDMAERNAKKLGIEAEFVHSDLFGHVEGCFSMILSNPPYIRTADIPSLQEEVSRYEPALALDGGGDGLRFYRKIIQGCRQYLIPGGYLLFEIGYGQAADVCRLMREAGFRRIAVKKDLAGLDRVVSGMYDVGKEL